MGLSISDKCGNILTTPSETVSGSAALRSRYLVDFILDYFAQLGPLYAVIACQINICARNYPEMNLALYQISRRDAFEGIVVFYAPSYAGWISDSRWRADKGLQCLTLGPLKI